jgi:hypothetical protein
MSNTFLALPPELRLEVYHYLFANLITDNKVGDVSGLIFSCREIYDEMNQDFVSKVRVLLNSLRRWTAAHPEKKPLHIQLPHDYAFAKPPTTAVITIPNSPFWESETLHLYRNSFRTTMNQLEPLFAHPWENLTWRISYSLTIHDDYQSKYSKMRFLMDSMWYYVLKRKRSSAFVMRLVMVMDARACSEHDERNMGVFSSILERYLILLVNYSGRHKYKGSMKKSVVDGRDHWDLTFNMAG